MPKGKDRIDEIVNSSHVFKRTCSKYKDTDITNTGKVVQLLI